MSGGMRREKWADIFKGIAIILVVIGHTTGIYNMYIYQFHMAAFFFISGYLVILERDGLGMIFWKRIYSLFMPFLFSFFLINVLEIILSFFHIQITSNFNFVVRLKELILYGSPGGILGPCWFIFALFGSIIISKILYDITVDNSTTYASISFLVFLVGYFFIGKVKEDSLRIPYYLDICLVTQFYISLGVLFRKYKDQFKRIEYYKYVPIPILAINFLLFYYFGNINLQLTDISSRSVFGNAFGNMMAAVNGIVFLLTISVLLEKVPPLEKLFSIIGSNTFGILTFHFLFFKLVNIVFYMFGMFEIHDLVNVVPPQELGNAFWPIYLMVAVPGSIAIWRVMQNFPVISIVMGSRKKEWNQIYIDKIQLLKVVQIIKLIKQNIIRSISKISKNIKGISTSEKVIWTLWYIAVIIPMIIQGIICNDELQTRLYSKIYSFIEFMKFYIWSDVMISGRALGSIWLSLGRQLEFLSENIYISRFVCVLVISMEIAAFFWLIYVLFKNKSMAIFAAVFTFVCMPVTFSLSSPNTFVIIYGVPLSFLMISISNWLLWIDQRRKVNLFLFGILFFLSMLPYEVFVTYTPIYVLIWVMKRMKQNKTIKDWLKGFYREGIIPVIIAVVYLILYVICRIVWPSQYEGTQLQFTVSGALANMKQLIVSGWPGYFLFSSKYRALTGIYAEKFSNNVLGYFRVLCGVCLSLLLIEKNIQRNAIKEKINIRDAAYLITGLLCCVLPALPNSVAKMYQGLIRPDALDVLPVSHFIYYGACFVCVLILWKCLNLFSRLGKAIIFAGILFLFGGIQLMNNVISTESYYNYVNLESTEKIFETNLMDAVNHSHIYANDIFISKDGLGIHDNYWTMVAQSNGLDISIEREYNEQPYYLYQYEDLFYLGNGTTQVLLAKTNLNGKKVLVKNGFSANYKEIVVSGGQKDHDFYIYYFDLSDGDVTLIPFEESDWSVGRTIDTINSNENIYDDGWVASNGGFKIRTGPLGEVHIKGYYNKEVSQDKWVKVLIDGEEQCTVRLDSMPLSVDLKTLPEKIVEVTFISNADEALSEQDLRKATFVLTDVYTD